MKMDIVAWSQNDEFYTPEYAVEPILKYLKPNSLVWCPFDTNDSNFLNLLLRAWHRVVHSHIELWADFFEEWAENIWFAKDCDYIISNPPYSMKTEVLQKPFKIWKPFAMLLWVVWLFESQKRFEMFRDNKFEIMYMNRRIAYFKDFSEQKPSLNPPFSSVYICSWILPQQIVFEEITKK